MNDDKKHCRGVFKEAWQKLKGMKRHFWASIILYLLINIGAFAALLLILLIGQALFLPNLLALVKTNAIFFLDPKFALPVGALVTVIVYYLGRGLFELFVVLPMRMGIFLIPLRKVSDKSVHALFIFKFFCWKYIWRFILLSAWLALLVGVPIGVGLFALSAAHSYHLVLTTQIACYVIGVLLLLYALYAIVNYSLVIFAIIDRDISAWKALQLSREAVVKRWFCIFGTLVWLAIVLAVGTLLFGIGLIWAVPYTQNVVAILYRDLIGIEGKDPVSIKGE